MTGTMGSTLRQRDAEVPAHLRESILKSLPRDHDVGDIEWCGRGADTHTRDAMQPTRSRSEMRCGGVLTTAVEVTEHGTVAAVWHGGRRGGGTAAAGHGAAAAGMIARRP